MLPRPRLSLLLACIVCAALSLAPSVRAQTASDTSDVAMYVQLPDTVVVTASRLVEPARQTGRRVTVFTQDDIRDLPVTTFEQLLDVVGGVDVQSRGGFGVQSDLTLRGSSFNGVLLLLDGARVNDPMTGHFLMDLPVPLSEIVRVEVLRGPATALYGPDALGGVVQLFTRTGLRQARMGGDGWRATAQGQYGDYDLYDAGGSVRYASDRFAISAAGVAQGSDGQPITTAAGDTVRGPNGLLRTDFTRRAGTAAAAVDLGGATLYARTGIDDRDFSAWHYYTPFASDSAREATSTYWAQTRLRSHREGATQWQVQLNGKLHEDRYVYNPQTPANEHRSGLAVMQAQVTHALDGLTLVGGLSTQLRGIDSNRYGVRDDRSAGAFFTLRWQPTDRLTINQSLRGDVDPLYGFEPTPQLYAAYALDAVTLRAGLGRAVRAPNYVERFIDSGGNRGTPDLDAERSWTAEVGADLHTGFGLTSHLTVFGRRTTDLIDYAQVNPSDEVFVARNLLEVETGGVELENTFTRSFRNVGAPGRDVGVRVTAAYTLLDALVDTGENVAAYKYARTSARHLLQGGVTARSGATSLGVQGLWKDRLSDDGLATASYGVVHARLGYTVGVSGTPVTLSVEVRNLFDETYTEVFDAPLPGRTFLVGARVAL